MKHKTYYFSKKKHVVYNEIFADSEVFEKFYEIENAKDADMIVIPDGSVDIQCIWKDGRMEISICGSVMNGMTSRVNQADRCFGARFRVGVLPKEIREHLDIITDNRVSIDKIVGLPDLRKYLSEELFLEQKADFMLNLFEHGEKGTENEIISYLLEEIEKHKGHIIVKDMIDGTGYSHRYVNHIFKSNVGCSVKKFASIVRLQQSLLCLLDKKEDAIYDELGYYDQAHFIKDFKNFSSFTPNKMKKNAGNVKFV